ncbi:IclR family transcriptional regulator domain-containing protein [Streptomyces tsukubensis]|uniref:IclR family transcriptional regulator domain-containing protein n=1 Tax=Streptomyces tsukubensis TaxID=83656 RepID=UPI00277B4957|nr:IclR family transcriptional regulator C-terminal domain-containing protein [Streptomyces tsukubensis]
MDEELERGLRSIAVPVRDRAGRAVAAVNVAMHSSSRTMEECLGAVLPQLRATGHLIENEFRTAARFSRITVARQWPGRGPTPSPARGATTAVLEAADSLIRQPGM